MSEILPDELFSEFRSIIYDQSGIHFSDSNRPILESRLRDRLRLSGLSTTAEYLSKIRQSPQEMKEFLDSITTNLTRFFRNQGQFDVLFQHVVPDLIERKKLTNDKMIRVWSAGCSTGEEPYTLAMVLDQILPKDFQYEITASDLSLKSLMTASQGFYPKMKMEGIPPEYTGQYFTEMESGYQIKEEIRTKVKFDYHNLKFDSGLRGLDIVFCRNVLIYFDEAAQKNVIDRFWNSMNSHSYLFIGHSESLFGLNTQFKFLKTDWAVLYTKHLS